MRHGDARCGMRTTDGRSGKRLPNSARQQSPFTHVAKIRTPLLILHGTADKATRPIVLGALEKSMGITELDPTLEKLIGSIPLGRIAPMLGLNAPELEGVLAKA